MQKVSHIRTILFILSAILFFAALGCILGGWTYFANTKKEGTFITPAVIGIILEIISIFLFKKIKYYCEKCGTKLIKTGKYRETGDFESKSSDTEFALFEHIDYEYRCPHCKNKTVISKKDKIASHRY